MKKGIFLYIFLIINAIALGQSPLRLSFHHLTREDGLSNNNIFYTNYDSRGFYWLCTLNGLNRFDGINCRIYKPSNSGIRGTHITNIVEDKNGNLYSGSEAGFNFYDRKKDDFSPILSPTGEKEFSCFVHAIDDKGLVWVILETKKRGLYTFNPALKKFTFITDEISDHLSTNQNTSLKPINTIFSGGKDGIGIRKISLVNDKVSKIESFFDGKNNQPSFLELQNYVFVENDSCIWITGNAMSLIKLNPIKNSFKTYQFFEKTKLKNLAQLVKYKNYLLIGASEGLYVFDKITEKFVQLIQHSATNPMSLSMNWIEKPFLDNQNNLFLSFPNDYTNLNRVIAEHWLTNEETKKMQYADNHITHIIQSGNQTWAKFQNGGTIVLDQNGKAIKKYEGLSPLITDSENRTWLTDGQQFFIENIQKKQRKKLIFDELNGQMGWQISMAEIEKGIFMIACNKGFFEYTEKTNRLKPLHEINNQKVIANSFIYYEKLSKQVFVSANWWQDFYVLKQENSVWKIRKKINFPLQSVTIRPSIQTNKIWVGTTKGLALVDVQRLDYQLFGEEKGLPDNAVTDIIEEPNGDHWLVTNKGISFYDFKKKTYRNFTSKDGAYSSEYDWNCAFKLPDGRVVFGGTNGITVINQDAIKRYDVKPKVQITQLSVNEKPLKTETYIGEANEVELQPDQNSFALDLVGIEYGFPQKVKIHYQLQGYDNQWITSKNTAVARYANVSEGTYQFLVKATDEDEKVSSEIRKLTVIVNAPFYRTTWFRLLLVLGFIGLGYLLYRLRVKQIREETQKKEEIRRIRAEAEINALRSQMNPHFIFNCLNTIDSYILLNKTDEASEFLNKFSKLIRMILENSRQEFVPLEQDLRALELYIKLEQERSYPKFLYEININEKLQEQQYFIPSMLLQPFVENAILHGLRHKKDEIGELFINIKQVDNLPDGRHGQLIIHIIDNGIGREAAKKINSLKQLTKRSIGIKLTEERIEKLNEIYPEKTYLKVTDINEENDKGTIVEIALPLLKHENLGV